MTTAPKPGYLTPEELADLTDEERAGLDPDQIPDDFDLPSGPDEKPETAKEETQPPAEKPAETEKPAQAETPETAKEETQPPAEKPAPAKKEPAPDVEARLREEEETRKAELAKVKAEKAAVLKRFRDGEIYEDERDDLLLELDERQQDVTLAYTRRIAELEYERRQAADVNEQRNRAYTSTIAENLARFGDGLKQGTPQWAMLDAYLRNAQETAADPYDPGFIRGVFDQFAQMTNLQPTKGTATPPPNMKPTAPREIPPTLGDMPTAKAESMSDDGEMAMLDAMPAEELEDAVVEGRISRSTMARLELYRRGK